MPRGKRPKWGIVSIDAVTFETELQQSKRQLRFSIPKEVARMLGAARSKKKLRLRIRHGRTSIWDDLKFLTSGTEITGAGMKGLLKAGDRIKVQVSRVQ